jgi:hypothetical protein
MFRYNNSVVAVFFLISILLFLRCQASAVAQPEQGQVYYYQYFDLLSFKGINVIQKPSQKGLSYGVHKLDSIRFKIIQYEAAIPISERLYLLSVQQSDTLFRSVYKGQEEKTDLGFPRTVDFYDEIGNAKGRLVKYSYQLSVSDKVYLLQSVNIMERNVDTLCYFYEPALKYKYSTDFKSLLIKPIPFYQEAHDMYISKYLSIDTTIQVIKQIIKPIENQRTDTIYERNQNRLNLIYNRSYW